jgi:hypothetical protein
LQKLPPSLSLHKQKLPPSLSPQTDIALKYKILCFENVQKVKSQMIICATLCMTLASILNSIQV